jgi:hypothetical protein
MDQTRLKSWLGPSLPRPVAVYMRVTSGTSTPSPSSVRFALLVTFLNGVFNRMEAGIGVLNLAIATVSTDFIEFVQCRRSRTRMCCVGHVHQDGGNSRVTGRHDQAAFVIMLRKVSISTFERTIAIALTSSDLGSIWANGTGIEVNFSA